MRKKLRTSQYLAHKSSTSLPVFSCFEKAPKSSIKHFLNSVIEVRKNEALMKMRDAHLSKGEGRMANSDHWIVHSRQEWLNCVMIGNGFEKTQMVLSYFFFFLF